MQSETEAAGRDRPVAFFDPAPAAGFKDAPAGGFIRPLTCSVTPGMKGMHASGDEEFRPGRSVDGVRP